MIIEIDNCLEIKKADARMVFARYEQEFGLAEKEAYQSRISAMRGMDHGPNHQEGDPVEHTALVVSALHNFLLREEGVPEADKRVLMYSAMVHDIAKADTFKYDMASGEQKKTLEALGRPLGAEDEARDKALFEEMLFVVSGLSQEEFAELSVSAKKKLRDEKENELQIILKSRIAEDGQAAHPAFLANFRDHDTVGARVAGELLGSNNSFSEAEKADIVWLVKYHMRFLRPEDQAAVPLSLFKEMCLRGEVLDERRLRMLVLHTKADNAGTYKPRKEGFDFNAALDERVDILKNAWKEEQKKLAETEAEKVFLANVFSPHNSLSEYLMARAKKSGISLPQGKEFGALLKKYNGIISTERAKGSSFAEIRKIIDEITFEQ